MFLLRFRNDLMLHISAIDRGGRYTLVASIGKIVSLAQGVAYFERDGYYACDRLEDQEASARAGKGAEASSLSCPVTQRP